MINKLKIVLTPLILITCLIFTATPAALAASPLDEACKGAASESPICKQSQEQNDNPSNPVSGPSGVINTAANIIAAAAGIGAIIMILIGAFFYVTSAGNADNAAKAKSRILSAFIGLVVVAMAWALVRLITDRVIR